MCLYIVYIFERYFPLKLEAAMLVVAFRGEDGVVSRPAAEGEER